MVSHGAYEAHGNSVARSYVVNFPLLPGHGLPAVFRPRAPDALLCAVRRGEMPDLLEIGEVPDRRLSDWPDLLAQELSEHAVVLEHWAENHGLRPETLSRGFGRAYGVAPSHFRRERQAHRALAAIRLDQLSLAQVALDSGFADQAHMTRAIKLLTGRTPRSLKVKSVQDHRYPRR